MGRGPLLYDDVTYVDDDVTYVDDDVTYGCAESGVGRGVLLGIPAAVS